MKKKKFASRISNDFLQKSFYDSDPSNVKSVSEEKKILFGNKTSSFESKIKEIETILGQQTKDFEDAKVDFSKKMDNRKDQFLKQIASFESKSASQDLISNQKEYNELSISYNSLKAKFDDLKREKGKSPMSNFSTPKVSVSPKIYTGESSKSFPKRVSQFTTYSLQKDRKFSKKPQVFETPTSKKVFNSSDSSKKRQTFKTPNSRFTPVKQVWRPKQRHSKPFKYSKSKMHSLQNKNDFALKIPNSGRFPLISRMNFQNETPGFNNRWKSSSSSRFKTPQENPSSHNQWKNKRTFKSPLIP
ncbi:hypothetical protein Tco_0311500 [Tanacetum coccineum]